MSCSAISIPPFDNITPVTPPIVNRNRNPNAHNTGVLKFILPPYIVAIQLNIFIPVGTAIIIVAAVKYALESTSIPTVYMWCAQTMNPRTPIDSIAYTIPKYPNIGFSAKVEITWEIIPKPGMMMI